MGVGQRPVFGETMARADSVELQHEVRKARRNFAAMAATYFLGVFNDNFYKQAAMLAAAGVAGSSRQGWLMMVFTAPFIVFAAPSGWLADRFPKGYVVIASKFLELFAMLAGGWAVLTGNWWLTVAMLGLMATQSAVFSPSLNGSIPELYPAEYVPRANAKLKVLTIGAILIGIATSGFALAVKGPEILGFPRGRFVVAVVVVAASAVGAAVSLGVPKRRAADSAVPFPWTGMAHTLHTLRDAARDRLLGITIAANAVIWSVASLQILLINAAGMAQFKVGATRTSMLVVAELAGIACGGLFAPRLSRGRRWYQILAPAAACLGGLMVAASLVTALPGGARFWTFFAILALMGAAGGMLLVPIESFIQVRPAPERKGAVLSAASFAAFSGMLLSGPFFNLLNRHMAPTTGFAVAGAVVLAVAVWLARVWRSSPSRRSASRQLIERMTGPLVDVLLRAFVKSALWLRYRVRVKGLDEVAASGRTGILFLPNHPGYIDPFIVLSILMKRFAPRILADKDQIDRFFVRHLARRIGARPIPDASRYAGAREQIDAAIAESIEGLRRGENLLFYPAGRVYRSWREDLGGASATETILKAVPDARVVLVRTTGLWGSMFTYAGGGPPAVGKAITKGVKTLLANGILFSPRREVTVEFIEPSDLPRDADRTTLNRHLEGFYNATARHNTYVPYTLWEGGGVRELPEAAGADSAAAAAGVSEATRDKVLARLRETTGKADIADSDSLGRDLGLDSLTRVDLMLWLEDEFGALNLEAEALATVADVLAAASGQAVSAAAKALKSIDPAWFVVRPRAPLEGSTIAEAFLSQAAAAPGKPAVADQSSGVKTYRDLLTAVYALRPEIERIPGRYVGIMLPASVAADTAYLAVMFAGKVPVMVNWTVGARNMEHSLTLLDVRAVLTARPLVTRVEFQLGDLGTLKNSFVYIEDVARRLSPLRKLLAAVYARLPLKPLGRHMDESAAVLFTSGSESLPKAVPLTHAKILADVRAVLAAVEVTDADRFVGIFPPFHSFGLTCTTILPLVAGTPVAHHPNPTEGADIARVIEAYQGTMLLGTPTFLRGIARAARPGQLDSLRLAVSGAEKCPDSLYDALERLNPNLKVLEGYGITECSPVVSVNDPRAPRRGAVGKVLPSIEWAIVRAETRRRVAAGEVGELLVRGENVFGGYLNYEGPSPFVDFEGKRWYRTGDLVSADAEGVLTFAGRLKRFIKLGGEMISLPAIEAVLDSIYPPVEGAPSVAVEAGGTEEAPEVVLFTTLDLERAAVNDRLRGAGLSALHGIRRVVKIEAIPLLGTGKTNYRELRAMIESERRA
jgi:acyl-CoA synthetase (AMP-forming)/AMP-acid ligase II/1-acyl-sn-glycerol-3-phosphate acyltransferase/acyl carrier protein